MRRIISDDQKKINEVKHLYKKQQKKKFNYNINDFFVEPTYAGSIEFKWKHKDWKTWMKGTKGFNQTKSIIKNYISECKKPYGHRDLSKFHLITS